MKNILVVAPHPDDETLGCGGTLLKHKEMGDQISWLIVTEMKESEGFVAEIVAKREEEIKTAANLYGFDQVKRLGFATTKLDTLPVGELVAAMSKAFQEIKPTVVYAPYPGDVHTDHRFVFDAVNACSKSFRYPFIKEVLCYETISETEFNLDPMASSFKPNRFVNIENHLDQKINIMKTFASELGEFPFPRSEKVIRAMAEWRGSMIGTKAAEAQMILKEVIL
ncbi:MAG: PIG-L family deacetylase [Deltaproteobacteria bacterium]|nr:PIG-L family deacetylase [Deltaproteobacteria bacterium]